MSNYKTGFITKIYRLHKVREQLRKNTKDYM